MSDNFSLIIKNGSCYIDGKLTQTDIVLSGNKIKKIGKIELNSSKVYDATDKVVLPGIIDTQTHFREPANNLTPQHPSTSFSLDNCSVFSGVAQK